MSLPGLTRQSIILRKKFSRRTMDPRVKPAGDAQWFGTLHQSTGNRSCVPQRRRGDLADCAPRPAVLSALAVGGFAFVRSGMIGRSKKILRPPPLGVGGPP